MIRIGAIFLLAGIAAVSAVSASMAHAEHYGERGRKITMVERVLRPSERAKVELRDAPIMSIDVVVRRERGGTETQLAAEIEGLIRLEPRQIDQNVNHVIRWDVGDRAPRGGELVLRAINGEVYVESVHVLYDRDRFNDDERPYRRDRSYERDHYRERDRYYDDDRPYRYDDRDYRY